MPRMLSLGSTGPDVGALQARLNGAPPSALAPLAADSIFGPKTRARVLEFQKSKGLVADGIVGPKTWAALADHPSCVEVPSRTCIDCGNPDPANKSIAALVGAMFGQGLAALGLIPNGAAFNPLGGFSLPTIPGLPSLPAPPNFRKLTSAEETTANGVFGSSLDYSTVFISDQSGAGNRPFTAAVPVPALVSQKFNIPSGTVQIMNLGKSYAAPGRNLLIHELTHVWQSQHATSKTRFMTNSLACQGTAIAANLGEVASAVAAFDLAKAKAIRSHPDFNGFYPFSAYAHIRGNPFDTYAAEQIANQVEHGVTAIVAHVAGVAKNSIDSDNDKSLKNDTNIEDVRRVGTVTP